MHAFTEIIEKLVEAVPTQTWQSQKYFPFKSLPELNAAVFDLCFFETNAQGGTGFLWIAFAGITTLYTMPFRLARHSEDGDLISLSPWSLKETYLDENFYDTWRVAQKLRNPIPTSKKGTFAYNKSYGESGFVALGIANNDKNAYVRLDYQVVYKIFKTIERGAVQPLEVEILSYLSQQSKFVNFPKLINVYELSTLEIKKAPVVIGLKYMQNTGMLLPYMVSLLQQVRFVKESIVSAQEKANGYAEKLGRLLGDFHVAMSFMGRDEQDSEHQWLATAKNKLLQRVEQVLALQEYFHSYAGVFYLLQNYVNKVLDNIQPGEDYGLFIRTHGNVHLEQILLAQEELILVNYGPDPFDVLPEWRLRQPCLDDAASLQASLCFAWHYAEKKYYDSLQTELSLLQDGDRAKISYTENKQGLGVLQEILIVYRKSYHQRLAEPLEAPALLPKNKNIATDVFNFCFLLKILKEILKTFAQRNGHAQIWMRILQDFMMTT